MSATFDLLLCGALVWLAWQVVAARALFRGVVLFMAFGLLMAVLWARLGAPDLALAEAVIGAGIMGALLLGACKAMLSDPGAPTGTPAAAPPMPRSLAALVSAAVGGVLAWLMTTAAGGGPTSAAVARVLPQHFLGNPVSVVLLDLRGYDTLMETAVLLLAFLGARGLFRQSELAPLFTPLPAQRRHTEPLVMLVTPLLILLALYLVWSGAHSPGGAFQAGALLGALGVMYRLTGRLGPAPDTGVGVRFLLVIGLLIFSLFACLGLAWSDAPLTYPAAGGYLAALAIEAALTVSIATTLVLLFAAQPGLRLEARE